jgi:hypothetical protein
MEIHTSHLRLSAAGKEAYAAHWCDNVSMKAHLVRESRASLVQALSGEPAGAGSLMCREVLLDVIAMAILHSNDIDSTPQSQAEAVLADILDTCLPIPGEKASKE